MMRPHLLRRKAAVWNRACIATQPELSAMVSFGTPGPRCAGDVFAPCYITALRRRGPRGEGVEGRHRIDQRRPCIDCDCNAQRFDQFFFGDTRLDRGVGVHSDASVALPRHDDGEDKRHSPYQRGWAKRPRSLSPHPRTTCCKAANGLFLGRVRVVTELLDCNVGRHSEVILRLAEPRTSEGNRLCRMARDRNRDQVVARGDAVGRVVMHPSGAGEKHLTHAWVAPEPIMPAAPPSSAAS